MENITVNMENLSEEEREQLMKLIEKSNGSKRNVWKPEGNEKYFFVSGCGVINSCKWINDTTDNGYYEIGNCFKTKEEAEFALEKEELKLNYIVLQKRIMNARLIGKTKIKINIICTMIM